MATFFIHCKRCTSQFVVGRSQIHFQICKHRYIDDMVNNFSKFNRPPFKSVLAALFHVNKMKHSHVAYRQVRAHHAELSFSLSVTECREGIECKGGSRGGALGACAPPLGSKKKNVSVERILKFTNEIKNLNNLNFESIEMIKQKDTV